MTKLNPQFGNARVIRLSHLQKELWVVVEIEAFTKGIVSSSGNRGIYGHAENVGGEREWMECDRKFG